MGQSCQPPTVVDGTFSYSWIIAVAICGCKLLTSKDEAAVTIKKFKIRAETESGKKLRTLRTDRGGEFTSMEFAA